MKHIQGRRIWELPDREKIDLDDLLLSVAQKRQLPKADVGVQPYSAIHDGSLLPDIDRAVEHLSSLIGTSHEVAVYGDYDIDGLTATTLVVTVLRQLGIRVRPYIPDRFEEGYGLNIGALEALAADGVHTVFTVDCGSTAIGPIKRAVELGLNLIVTDHHLVGSHEPEGLIAHVNPQRASSRYAQPGIAGVGVAWHVMRALQQKHLNIIPEGQEKWWLDLVALGTVCDVVPLVGDNRIFTQFGLRVLSQTRRPGLRALAEVSATPLDRIQASDLGFRYGPRLNASGRLEHARLSLDILLADDNAKALQYARDLDALNAKRQKLVASILEQARAQAAEQSDRAFLVVSDAEWSHGVAGLIAARLAEEFKKPTVVLQQVGDESKGSARTFAGIHVLDVLHSAKSLLVRYGGHAAAAGLTLATKDIAKLRDKLNTAVRTLPAEQWLDKKSADAWLDTSYISTAGLAAVRQFEPTGRGHEPLIFVVEAEITGLRWVGSDQTHAQLHLTFNDVAHRMMAFSALRIWPWLKVGEQVRAYVQLVGNVWQGIERPDLHVVDIEKIIE